MIQFTEMNSVSCHLQLPVIMTILLFYCGVKGKHFKWNRFEIPCTEHNFEDRKELLKMRSLELKCPPPPPIIFNKRLSLILFLRSYLYSYLRGKVTAVSSRIGYAYFWNPEPWCNLFFSIWIKKKNRTENDTSHPKCIRTSQ